MIAENADELLLGVVMKKRCYTVPLRFLLFEWSHCIYLHYINLSNYYYPELLTFHMCTDVNSQAPA